VWSLLGVAGVAPGTQETLERARVIALAVVPFAFLAGLLRSRVAGAAAVSELRDLARGIHPAVLSDRGLGPALEALAQRMPLPIEIVGAPRQRLPEPVEAAAYFVVAEAITNVARYAHATHARVDVSRNGDRLVIEVADDGVGGADPGKGSGLRGLADRIAALDGRLEIESGDTRGTTVRAVIPCA
jgi:signal transduction histidine kinase